MRKWIHALTLMLALSAACPALASTISIPGADNALAPPTLARPYRVDGVLDWTTFNLDANSTVRFGQQQNAGQLLLGDLLIVGTIDASGINLARETPGRIVVAGSILADSLSLSTVLLAGSITLTSDALHLVSGSGTSSLRGSGGDISLRGSGGNISLISSSVPEPATLWLLLMLLPILMLRGRKRTSHGC